LNFFPGFILREKKRLKEKVSTCLEASGVERVFTPNFQRVAERDSKRKKVNVRELKKLSSIFVKRENEGFKNEGSMVDRERF
jgi:hypothetical protein